MVCHSSDPAPVVEGRLKSCVDSSYKDFEEKRSKYYLELRSTQINQYGETEYTVNVRTSIFKIKMNARKFKIYFSSLPDGKSSAANAAFYKGTSMILFPFSIIIAVFIVACIVGLIGVFADKIDNSLVKEIIPKTALFMATVIGASIPVKILFDHINGGRYAIEIIKNKICRTNEIKAVKICGQCGYNVKDDAKFCFNCGAPLYYHADNRKADQSEIL